MTADPSLPDERPPAGSGLETMSMPAVRDPASDAAMVGVLIVLPEPYHGRLTRERSDFGDPDAEDIPPHITLLPPTRVEPDDVSAFQAHLRRVAARNKRFPVRLEGTGTFRPVSPVVFVRVERGAAGCDALQQQIRSGPVARPLEFPFHPHVTVAHNLGEPTLDLAQRRLKDFVATFDVGEFWLFEHGRDGRWRATDRFELR